MMSYAAPDRLLLRTSTFLKKYYLIKLDKLSISYSLKNVHTLTYFIYLNTFNDEGIGMNAIDYTHSFAPI